MLAMGCAELGNAVWLMFATGMGFPVSTTQTIVGALIGVGFATQAAIIWEWTGGSISQIAASWAIAPVIAACFSALVFATVKYSVLERKDSFKWGMRLIPWYFGFTAGVLALFLAIEVPNAPTLAEVAGEIAGSILAVFFGFVILGYVFMVPFFKAKLVREDPRIRIWHLPLGPLLLKDNPPLYWPGTGTEFVTNYYEDAYGNVTAGKKDEEKGLFYTPDASTRDEKLGEQESNGSDRDAVASSVDVGGANVTSRMTAAIRKQHIEPYPRWIKPVKELSWFNPKKLFNWCKFLLLQGISRDCVTHDTAALRAIHARAHRYDVRVEHMWTYCQVISAMMMSIAHGSNDVANAVGPWSASYQTFRAGIVNTESNTPVWMLAVAGLLLGLGFWFFGERYRDMARAETLADGESFCVGYHIIRALGNKITQMSPSRGFSVELDAAITVLLASRLGLPVSTTQCLTGAALGVALMVSAGDCAL